MSNSRPPFDYFRSKRVLATKRYMRNKPVATARKTWRTAPRRTLGLTGRFTSVRRQLFDRDNATTSRPYATPYMQVPRFESYTRNTSGPWHAQLGARWRSGNYSRAPSREMLLQWLGSTGEQQAQAKHDELMTRLDKLETRILHQFLKEEAEPPGSMGTTEQAPSSSMSSQESTVLISPSVSSTGIQCNSPSKEDS